MLNLDACLGQGGAPVGRRWFKWLLKELLVLVNAPLSGNLNVLYCVNVAHHFPGVQKQEESEKMQLCCEIFRGFGSFRQAPFRRLPDLWQGSSSGRTAVLSSLPSDRIVLRLGNGK